MSESTSRQVLDLLMQPNDAGATTVRDYLIELLAQLWARGSDFNAKRPFGNSSWSYDLYQPLMRAGLIEGAFDEDGYVDSCDTARADQLIDAAIRSLAQSGDADA